MGYLCSYLKCPLRANLNDCCLKLLVNSEKLDLLEPGYLKLQTCSHTVFWQLSRVRHGVDLNSVLMFEFTDLARLYFH